MAERFLPSISFGDDAKSKLLEAGWEMMAAADGTILEAGFNPERIASQAGVSRRTFYRYFPDKYEYTVAMFAAVLGNSSSEAAAAHIEKMPAYDLGDMFYVLRDNAQRYWDDIGLNETLLARVSLLTLAGNSPGVLETARNTYEESIDLYVPIWDALFVAWDIELRPPWTTHRFAAFTGALVDGMVLRRLYDPDGFETMLADVSCALTPMLFRLRGDAVAGLDDVGNRFADEVRKRWVEKQEVEETLSGSEAIAEALVKLLSQRGRRETTIDAIALEAGVSVGLVRAKGTVDEQICRVVEGLLDNIEDELKLDISAGDLDRTGVVGRHSRRLRAVTAANRTIVQAFLELRVLGLCETEYNAAFGSLTRAAEGVDAELRLEADSIVAYAEEVMFSELFSWKSRQTLEL